LITWLTYHEFTGTQFKAAFLLTFRTMGVEPAFLLDMLIERYQKPLSDRHSAHDPSSKAGQLKEKIARIEREQHKKCVRARVLDVISKWITTYPSDFINGKVSSSLIIETLLHFLENEAMKDFDTKAKRIRRSILFELGHMQSRVDEQLPTHSDYPEPKPLHK
jgi:RasGEF N-terminal motif